jgi:hypothetical protein
VTAILFTLKSRRRIFNVPPQAAAPRTLRHYRSGDRGTGDVGGRAGRPPETVHNANSDMQPKPG